MKISAKRSLVLLLSVALTFFGTSSAQAIDTPSDAPSVRIVPGSDINLLSSSSAIPIRIQNDFDVDVRVQVHALTTNGRISVPGAIEVDVPAGTAITAKLPVNATSTGQVDLVVWLETFSGLSLNSKTTLHINVNPDAETAIVVGFIASVSALLTFGVIRTLRKRRAVHS